MNCPICVAEIPDDDLFCENCGAKLTPDPEVERCSCGSLAEDVDEDGFCLSCGKRLRRPPSDHMEEELTASFAAVSDRGLRHDRNEDRFALVQAEGGLGLIVCDGVSMTRNADVASATVTEIVARCLRDRLGSGILENPEQELLHAISQASEQFAQEPQDRSGEPSPSTTIVAALVVGDEIAIAWAGDSRAYWIDSQGAELLTRDHSWLNDVVSTGEVDEATALASPQAHAITRWLGADADPETPPETVRRKWQGSGALMLCTDGLWNYVPDATAMAQLFGEARGEHSNALNVSRKLVEFANAQGGRDNVTIALVFLNGAQPEAAAQEIEPIDR